jgi:hypothetical protein
MSRPPHRNDRDHSTTDNREASGDRANVYSHLTSSGGAGAMLAYPTNVTAAVTTDDEQLASDHVATAAP